MTKYCQFICLLATLSAALLIMPIKKALETDDKSIKPARLFDGVLISRFNSFKSSKALVVRVDWLSSDTRRKAAVHISYCGYKEKTIYDLALDFLFQMHYCVLHAPASASFYDKTQQEFVVSRPTAMSLLNYSINFKISSGVWKFVLMCSTSVIFLLNATANRSSK